MSIPYFYGPKDTWDAAQRGADLVTGTGKAALEDAAVTIQLVL